MFSKLTQEEREVLQAIFLLAVIRGSRAKACWTWRGNKTKSNPRYSYAVYGVIAPYGKNIRLRAHRVAYELFVGPIPDGMEVCHHCDNPICVKPDHLFVGTHTDNMQDAVKKGRNWSNFRENPDAIRGANNHKSKLTVEIIHEIRRLCAEGNVSYTGVGRKFGVDRTTVKRIHTRQLWAHVP